MNLRRPAGLSGSVGLLAFFALLAVVCMAIPFSLGTTSLYSAVDDRMSESSRLTAQAVAVDLSNLTSLLSINASDSRLLITDAVAGDVDNPQRQLVDSLRLSSTSIKATAYYDVTGTLLVDSPLDANVGSNFAYRPYFTKAMASPGSVYISDPFASKISGQPTLIGVSSAVLAPAGAPNAGQPVGVLLVALDVNKVLKPFTDTFVSSDGIDVAIYDSAGHRIVGDMTLDDSDSAFQDRLADVRVSDAFEGEVTEDEQKYLLSMTPAGDSGLVVVSAAKASTAYGPLIRFQHQMIVLAAIGGTGMMACVLLLARSFRSRDRAMREVRTYGKRTEQILETAAETYVELGEDGVVTAWNRAAETLFGWSADEVMGKDIHPFIIPEVDRDRTRESFLKSIETFSGTSVARKYERKLVRRHSKEPFPVIITAWITDLEGERRMSLFMEDVTERRQLDAARELVFRRQRELVEELRTADQTKSDFMSTVSHELRTPLTSILGYLEMLQDSYGSEFNKQAASMIDVIDRNANRLLGLIEDLLTLSRIESGSEKTFSSLVDVQWLANQATQSLLPSVRDRSVEMVQDIATGLPPVEGDENQLERVLLNVLSNAVKFTPPGGRITLRARQDEQSVRIEISDTGIGIPLEEQNRLFSRFFRSTSARDQQIQGTGLGLTIVKSIVERHGGTVKVSSLPDVGTTVTISLPVAVERVVI